MKNLLFPILYFVGIIVMFFPTFTGWEHNIYYIAAGVIISTFSLLFNIPEKKCDDDLLDSYMTDEQELAFWRSDEFRQHLAKTIEDETWGKGLPKVYMNKEKQIIKHWKDGRIEIIKDLNDEHT